MSTFTKSGWRTHVVASWRLSQEVAKYKSLLNSEYFSVRKDTQLGNSSNQTVDKEDGWIELLSLRLERYFPETGHAAMRRWIYRFENNEALVTDAERAEATMFVICGKSLDEAGIEAFPGNFEMARQQIIDMNDITYHRDLSNEEIDMLATWQIDRRDAEVFKYGTPTFHIRTNAARQERRRGQRRQAA